MMERFSNEITALGHEGGWVFWCLVVLGFGIAFALFSIWQFLRVAGAGLDRMVPLKGAEKQRGERAGEMRELEGRLFADLGRRIPFAFVLIGAAPLVGLLGTVSGMFSTFDGMAGAAAVAPVDIISNGVSEALITTQTGLIISVPTFIVCMMLRGRYQHLRNRFERMEAGLLQGTD